MKLYTRSLKRDIITVDDDGTKTVTKGNYIDMYEIDQHRRQNLDQFIFIVSGRTSVGKSYALKIGDIKRDNPKDEYPSVMNCIRQGKKFLLVRSSDEELKATPAWLAEMLPTFNEEFECDFSRVVHGKPTAGAISIFYEFHDDDGHIDERKIHIGYHINLDKGISVKGGWHEDVILLIYEEYNAPALPLAKRKLLVFKFVEMMMTFFRERYVPCFFVANNVGGTNPIEVEFASNPKMVKWKIFKKLPEGSSYEGLSAGMRGYLEGQEFFKADKANMKLYQQISWVKVGSENFYIYQHKYKRIGKDSYIISHTGEQGLYGRYEIEPFLFNMIDEIDFLYTNSKIEVAFYENYHNILNILSQRLPVVKIPLKLGRKN